MSPTSRLAVEFATYQEMRRDLTRKYPGKWVLIRGRDFVGTYTTQDAALEAGYTRFGYVDLFTKRLDADERRVVLASRRANPIDEDLPS